MGGDAPAGWRADRGVPEGSGREDGPCAMNHRAFSRLALVRVLLLLGCESGGGGMTPGTILGAMTQGVTGANPPDVPCPAVDLDEPEGIERARSVAAPAGSGYA